ncbi:MAG: flagellar motor switch protein FliN/FliY [Candidatus Frackibacter sp. T328-2]|nr:MAG: flagellar motor switch protein FliN/FliY [Candidatus Frackibacter sp. T328-2]
MSDETLSQEEINALLASNNDDENDVDSEDNERDEENINNEEDKNTESKSNDGRDYGVELTDVEKDAIGEIGNISMGSAATALYSLLNKTVEITAPKVSLSTLSELINKYERPCVLVDVEYVEGLEGLNMLIIQERDAAIISDLMMGGDGSEPDEELNELHLSAVSEAMNQMMGSASTSMSAVMQGDKVNISPPNAELLTLNSDEIKDRDFNVEEPIIRVAFDLNIGDLIDSEIVQLMPVDFAKELVEYLVNPPEEEETASAQADAIVEENVDEPVSKQVANSKQQEQTANTQQPVQNNQHPQPQMQTNQQAQQMQQQMEASKSGAVNRQDNVDVQSVQFSQLGNGQATGMQNNINLIQDVPLEVTVRLGKTKMLIKDILELGNGSVIELDKLAGEAVDLLVNGKLVAKGEVVVIDENFGFRVTDIVSPMERINSL